MTLNIAKVPRQSLSKSIAAISGTKFITPDSLLDMPKTNFEDSYINWLDNFHLIYSFPPVKLNDARRIEIIDIRTNNIKLLGVGSIPIPSPDGTWIAFIYGENKKKQLWVMKSDGSDRRQLSHLEHSLTHYKYTYDFVWSPDSKRIALHHQPYIPHWENKPRAISMVDIIDVVTGKFKQIASIDARLRYFSWLPNGKEILFMKEQHGLLYDEENDYEWVQAVNVNSGSVKTIIQFDGLQQYLQPIASPDGRCAAVMYDANNPSYNFMPSLGLISLDKSIDDNSLSPISRLTYEMKLDSPRWSNDGKKIFVKRDFGAYFQIYAIDAETGKPAQITHESLSIESYAISPDGKQLGWIGHNAQATRVLQIAKSNGDDVRHLVTMISVSNDMALSEVREIDWKSVDYPARMRGLIFLPLNYEEGQRYPLIVDIHGGDVGARIYLMGGILVSSPLEWHMWAAKGYVVFVPEFRSSASFGALAVTRDCLKEHNRLGGDLNDIESGVDALVAQGIVDSDRLAIIGHSAGALRANWFAVTTHRYKAIVSKEGWADELIPALKRPVSNRVNLLFGGSPHDVPENYLKNSAVHYSKGATTPTLFLMGNPELGGVDKYDTVNMLHLALKSQGVETEYVFYPDEGHLLEKEKNRRDALERSIQWIDAHLK